ncbi:hypothetical protein BH11ARM2_BH11ARM2_06950 [soil metagenome]
MIPLFTAAMFAIQASQAGLPSDAGRLSRIEVVVNGRPLPGTALIRDNRVLVPMRPVFEALGATVQWYPENRKVVGQKDGKTVTLVLDQNFAYGAGSVLLDYPPRMIDGRVMVPLRFVGEALGATVIWNRDTLTARVELGDGGVASE